MADIRSLSGRFGIDEEPDIIQQSLPANDIILQNKVPWETLQQATIITSAQLDLIRQYDVQNQVSQDQLLQQHPVEYAQLFYTLVADINKDDTLQYVLALLDKLLNVDEDRVDLFLDIANPYEPFVRVLSRATAGVFSTAKASKILAMLLIRKRDGPAEVTAHLLSWCVEKLRSQTIVEVSTALSTLQVLLRCDTYRLTFFKQDALNLLAGSLRSQIAQNTSQLTYQTLYCLWLLSYNTEIASQFHRTRVIHKIVDTIRQVSKVKVSRVGLATLRNLIEEPENGEQMIDADLMRVLDNFAQRKWGDDDIAECIEVLTESLQQNIAKLSSFDMYKKEVLSGELDWTPAHKSEKFWRENVMKFEEKQFELLGVLVSILRTSQNSLSLAIACYDLGEFIRFHPRGRAIIQGLGAKVSIMKLMAHQDDDVKKEALLCVQKLMVVNWEYLAR